MILDKSIKSIKGSAKLIRELADLYYITFEEQMKVGCGACYDKAYIRLKQKLNILENKKEVKEKNFVLKVGYIREFNSREMYTNDNLTDEVAIAYLKKNINRKVQFSKLPENLEELLNGKPKKKPITKVKKVVKEETKKD